MLCDDMDHMLFSGFTSPRKRPSIFGNPQHLLQKPEREVKEVQSKSYRRLGQGLLLGQ